MIFCCEDDRVLKSWGVDAHNSHTNVCSSSARVGYALWSGADRPSPDHANAKFILMLSAHLETGHYFNPHAQRIVEGMNAGAKLCVMMMSWMFFLCHILISLVFVLFVPIGVLLSVENLPLRIFLASLSAAPAYSNVKMATVKFFLEVYGPYPEIRREYSEYFEALPN